MKDKLSEQLSGVDALFVAWGEMRAAALSLLSAQPARMTVAAARLENATEEMEQAMSAVMTDRLERGRP